MGFADFLGVAIDAVPDGEGGGLFKFTSGDKTSFLTVTRMRGGLVSHVVHDDGDSSMFWADGRAGDES
ncbi:MAG: hypothetical protein ACRBI6_16125 [Acidimicrobiales bacterium]